MNDLCAETGDVIDNKYVLLRQIGKGGMGVVFEAKHKELPGKVAIKFLLMTGWNGPTEQQRFLREAHAGRKLESEFSVRVTDFGKFFKRGEFFPYIVMEYLEGKNLGDLVEVAGPLSVSVAVDYILQACIALAEAHGKGILHRDLKPNNLFLANRVGTAIIKVLDFGLAKDAATLMGSDGKPMTDTGMIAGTPGYMPREQLRGLSHTCRQTDIFSLAVCLYYFLTGIRPFGPFEGDELADVTGRVWNGEPPPLMQTFRPDIPLGLVNVVIGALAKDPVDRPPSIVDFARALVSYGSADAARMVNIVERTAKAASEAAANSDDGGITIKNNDNRQPETADLARTPPTPSQTRSRCTIRIATIAGVVALLTMILVLISQYGSDFTEKVPVPPLVMSATPPVLVESSASSHPQPLPLASASASASSSRPPSASPTRVQTKKTTQNVSDNNKF